MPGPLTIARVIEAEVMRGKLTEEGCKEITPEMRAMVVYHHEWAREKHPAGHQGLICVMWASRGDEKGHVFGHHLGAKNLAPITKDDIGGLDFLDTD